MAVRAQTLFSYDARGRISKTNDPDGSPAPHVFLGHWKDGHVIRVGEAVTDLLERDVGLIVERRLPAADIGIPDPILSAVRERLERDGIVSREGGGPVYRFPTVEPPGTDVIEVTPNNIEVVRNTYPWLYVELEPWRPCFAVVRYGEAASVCFSSRNGRVAAEAGVDTLAPCRGRGFATAVTATWAEAVKDSGRIPLYSTAWNNLASRGVACRMGLQMFGTDATWS